MRHIEPRHITKMPCPRTECEGRLHPCNIQPQEKGFTGGWKAGDVLECGYVVRVEDLDEHRTAILATLQDDYE